MIIYTELAVLIKKALIARLGELHCLNIIIPSKELRNKIPAIEQLNADFHRAQWFVVSNIEDCGLIREALVSFIENPNRRINSKDLSSIKKMVKDLFFYSVTNGNAMKKLLRNAS